LRVVGGKFRGRALAAPAHDGLRPTSDRVRQALFDILAHGIADFDLDGATVVDFFAGTGALGLEALSRGAAFCVFVEDDADARALIRRNIEAFGLTGQTRIYRRDATDLGPASPRDVATLAFVDPPYGLGLAARCLASAIGGGWLAPGGIVVIEERAGVSVSLPDAMTLLDQRVHGDTQIHIGRLGPSA